MSRQALRRAPLLAVLVILVLAASASLATSASLAPASLASSVPAADKKPLTYDAYNGWRSIQGTTLSRDGVWLAYALVPQDGDGELVVLDLRTNREHRAARGRSPVITADGRYVVFTIAPAKADVDKAKKDKKKPDEQPKNALGILSLATGEVTTIERVKSFLVPEDSGAYVAYLHEKPLPKPAEKKEPGEKTEEKKAEPPAKAEPAAKPEPAQEEAAAEKTEEKKKDPGTDFVIRELATGREVKIPEVLEYAWNEPGTWLAYTVSSKEPEKDGAFAWEAASGKTVSLLQGLGHYKTLTFDKKGAQIAFLSDRDDYKADAPVFKLYHWAAPAAAAAEAAPASHSMPKGMTVSEHGRLQFSEDGGRLFLGIAPAPVAPPKDAPEPIKVDIWHWQDPHLQPMQAVRAEQEKKRTYTCVLHLGARDHKFVQLGAPDLPDIILSDDARLAIGRSDAAYQQLISWDTGYADYYLVNVADGSRTKVLEQWPNPVSISPGNTHLLYFDQRDDEWYAYRISDGKVFNLTSKIDARFEMEDWDTPDEPRPYGSPGWTDGDRSVLIYDRFDIWEISPDGSRVRNATKGLGRRDNIVFRYYRLDRELKTVPSKSPIHLSAVDDKTKASGAWRLTLAADAPPAKVVMHVKLMGGVQKAEASDVYVFTLQRFEEFPNLWVSGPDLAAARKVSDANPQQAEYRWGKAELIEYINADGKTLPAVLIKPDDFDPSKKYPLMVYIYETLASSLHRYYTPSPGTSINMSRYVSNGYIILQPDIVYETGYPGPSSLKCVVPAVQHILAQGYIDPQRVGIQGHSWGGYQISYLITQTDIFKAVQGGASVVNMTSAYGGIRWGSGMSRAFQYERTQSRIGDTLWTRTEQYIANSPLFWVERVNTPYLTIHNDEDDAVPWYQGIEFFSALRRLGKEAYMFNYNTEKHGLRQRENQKHWTVHQDEFFDHYLLGAPKPDWMENGVPYLERGKRDIDSLFKTEAEKAAEKAEKEKAEKEKAEKAAKAEKK